MVAGPCKKARPAQDCQGKKIAVVRPIVPKGLKHKQPLTGWINFDSAINAFRNRRKSLVISRVDKAANYLCIICKACYVQLATAEMEGLGYSRVKGEDLVSIKSAIVIPFGTISLTTAIFFLFINSKLNFSDQLPPPR